MMIALHVWNAKDSFGEEVVTPRSGFRNAVR